MDSRVATNTIRKSQDRDVTWKRTTMSDICKEGIHSSTMTSCKAQRKLERAQERITLKRLRVQEFVLTIVLQMSLEGICI